MGLRHLIQPSAWGRGGPNTNSYMAFEQSVQRGRRISLPHPGQKWPEKCFCIHCLGEATLFSVSQTMLGKEG